MSEEKTQYWENKVVRGIGTLYDFVKDYDLVSSMPGQFITASNHTLTGNAPVEDCAGVHKLGIYEWVIFYKKNPNQNKTVDEKTGKVETKPKELSLE